MINDWAKGIDETYICDWANKGLYRRGTKTLAKQDLDTWSFSSNEVLANIDGYAQAARGNGFDGLSCTCPATAACHHLVCLLLGIQSHYQQQTLPTDQTDRSLGGSGEDEHAESLSPWIIPDKSERQKKLGKAQLDRALRWLAFELKIDVDENQYTLRATVYESEAYRITIPRVGGIAAAICSCKKVKCVHLAYAVVHQTQHWCDKNSDSEGLKSEIGVDQHMRESLAGLDEWLAQILVQGLGSISDAHREFGTAIATDLRQADLPNLANQVSSLLLLLKREKQSSVHSDLGEVRQALARLYASLTALKSEEPTQALVKLAGQHRRMFFLQRHISLCGLASQTWRTESGFSGYTVYFYCPDDGQTYWLSDSRNTRYDHNWSANTELAKRSIDGHRISELMGQSFVLRNAKLSHDSKLNIDANTEVEGLSSVSNLVVVDAIKSHNGLLPWLEQLAENPYQHSLSLNSTVISDIEKPVYHRLKNRWECAAQGQNGQINIVLENKQGKKQFEYLRLTALAMLGRWGIQNFELTWFPLVVLSKDKTIALPQG